MRILIFGPNGQLGNSLKDLQPKGMKVSYAGRSEVDLSNEKDLKAQQILPGKVFKRW